MNPPAADTSDDRFEALCRDRRSRFAAAIQDHIERLGWGTERVVAHQRQRLRELLAHAIERSSFHAERLRGVDPTSFELQDLPDLPVMTKRQMMADFDAVVTDPRLTRQVVEEHLASLNDRPEFLLDDYTCFLTGGASGERGIFVHDADELVDYLAAASRRTISAILAAGGPPPGGVPTAFVAAGSPAHATYALAAIFTGDLVSATLAPATLPLPGVVARLNEVQPAAIVGYPSILRRLAGEQRAGRLAISPFAISASAETLTAGVRHDIGEAFGVPVANQFGSCEGLFGVSPPGDDPIVFTSDLAIVELVDDDLQPVPPGTPSSRVLLTNLFNHTQPLIRYELTDRFVRWPAAPEHGHLRATVEGRSSDLLRWGDQVLHPHAVIALLLRNREVLDFQVRQNPVGIDVAVTTADPLDTDSLARQLTDALREAGLRRARATVTAVAALPRHPETGKLVQFVPHR